MLLLAAAVLFLMALVNYRVGGRGLFHPAVAFCMVWCIDLVLIWLVGDFFFTLLPTTILVFVGGALAFSVGATIAMFWPQKVDAKPLVPFSSRLISLLVLVVVLGTPLAVRWMFNQIAEHPSPNFFISASLTMLDESVQESLGYTLFANLITLANMAALITFFERKRHGKRFLLVVSLALGLDVLTAGRSAFAVLILSLFCLDWILNRRIRWKLLLPLGVVLLGLASALAVVLGKGEATVDASIADNAAPVVHGLVLYAAGGMVAFDRVVRDPGIQPRDFQIGEFFIRILDKFGAGIELPNTSAGFLDIGPDLGMNVYTIYYSYLDLGYPCMMAMMAVLGIIVTICYRRALLGSQNSAMLYSALFAGLILSPFAELFFHNLNYLVKFYVVLLLVYSVPGIWPSWRGLLVYNIKSQLAARRQT